MSSALIVPHNETARLLALKKLMALEANQEPILNELVKLAAEVCNTKFALISIITANQQLIKANIGLDGIVEISRENAICAHTILSDALIEIPDASTEPRFSNADLVRQAPYIRFYAGVPISIPNQVNVGSICVMDSKPNALSSSQKTQLNVLAELAAEVIKMRTHANHQLSLIETRLHSVLNSSEDAIITKSLDGTVLSWNQGAEEIFGYTESEMIGRLITRLFPKDCLDEESMLINKIINNEPVKQYEATRIRKNGQVVYVSISLSPMFDTGGKLIGITKIARDISAQKQLQSKLEEQIERQRVTVDSIGDGIITTNSAGEIEYLNPIAEKLTGWKLAESIGKPLLQVFNIVNAETRHPCFNPLTLAIQQKKIVGLPENTLLINRDGSEYLIEDSASPIRNKQGHVLGAVLVFHDVTTQKKLTKELTYRATHDPLTGLINRTELEKKINILLNNEDRHEHALLFIDLDHFKIVNDVCGHNAGDTLLKAISSLIWGCIRSTETFARIGGDEFAIVLENCNIDNAMAIAQSICNAVDGYRFITEKRRFHLGCSIGLVMVDSLWLSSEQLMLAADQACYCAKESGRNRVHLYIDADRSEKIRRLEVNWAHRIEEAIEENKFILYCQRIYPLDNSGLMHGEILIRLKDDNGEIFSPNAFLPAADRYHMTARIDKWVISNTIQWLHLNKDKLQHIDCISINLSGQSLGDHHLQTYIMSLLQEYSIDCTKVCFEITETAAITNIVAATKFIEVMRNMGIRFSLDDFGSGVSSFGYLKNLNVDYIKIDGIFIKGLKNNPIDLATVRCISEIAKVTLKKTIAEWVEDVETEDLLKEIGVNYTQGYLKHKPEPLDFMLETGIPRQIGLQSNS